MKNKIAIYHFCTIVAFVGVLLTFAVFYLINTFVVNKSDRAPVCYTGDAIEGTGFFEDFNRAVYQSKDSLTLIRASQYRFFGTIHSDNVVAGEGDFLFEVYDEENDYPYFDDFMGKCSFSEEECAAILHALEEKKASYAARGAEYLLVILPNAQSVYPEYMPAYVGIPSSETRLTRLETYLRSNGFGSFANLTQELRAYKDKDRLYNNTENSLNSLGIYYTYRCVYERFTDTVMENTEVLKRENLNFYRHNTTGMRLAQMAGLEEVVPNLTVSLSNDTKLHYRVIYDAGYAFKTFLVPFEFSINTDDSPSLLLQFTGSWERSQMEPFASNTFSTVTYQVGLEDNAKVFNKAAPRVVIQFIYENELSQLIPS